MLAFGSELAVVVELLDDDSTLNGRAGSVVIARCSVVAVVISLVSSVTSSVAAAVCRGERCVVVLLALRLRPPERASTVGSDAVVVVVSAVVVVVVSITSNMLFLFLSQREVSGSRLEGVVD